MVTTELTIDDLASKNAGYWANLKGIKLQAGPFSFVRVREGVRFGVFLAVISLGFSHARAGR